MRISRDWEILCSEASRRECERKQLVCPVGRFVSTINAKGRVSRLEAWEVRNGGRKGGRGAAGVFGVGGGGNGGVRGDVM